MPARRAYEAVIVRWLGRAAAAALLMGGALPAQQPAFRPHDAIPSEARSVSGRVVRGARTRVLPMPGALVVLHRVGTDHAAPLDSVRTDAAGRFAFRYRTSGDARAIYFASSVYGGIAYFTAPFTTATVSGDDAELVVHDTTSGPVPILVRARHVVLSAPARDGARSVIEVFELSNDSSVTRIAAGARGVVWESALFDGARDPHVGQTDFSSDAIRFDAGRARLSAPFAPGLKQLSFSYTVPSADEYMFHLDASAGILEVLVEDALGRAQGAGLIAAGPTTVNGRTFARFLSQDAGAGAVVHITTPGERAMGGTQVRVLAVVAALGAVLLIGLARAMMRRQGRRHATAADAPALRAQLQALDAEFAKIANPTEDQRADHWEQRALLVQQITDAVAREQGLS